MKLNTSLLREKFIIKGIDDDTSKQLNLTARSNRLPLMLTTGENKPEILVVRAFNMHSCIRLAAAIVNEFNKFGPIMSRNPPLKWDLLWDEVVTSPFERQHFPEMWGCVYHNGKIVFQVGEHHSFLDVIEKCDFVTKQSYEKCIEMAEETFKKAGKPVKIHHDSNIGLVAAIEKQQARSGMVLRSVERATTFNFYVKAEGKVIIDPAQVLFVSAAFLEGVQLAYYIGFSLEKMRVGLIEPYSEEHRKLKGAQQRLVKLDGEINSFENKNSVRYRPERPLFNVIVSNTEKIAATMVLRDDDDDEVYVE